MALQSDSNSISNKETPFPYNPLQIGSDFIVTKSMKPKRHNMMVNAGIRSTIWTEIRESWLDHGLILHCMVLDYIVTYIVTNKNETKLEGWPCKRFRYFLVFPNKYSNTRSQNQS